MDEDLFAVCREHVSQHYELLLQRPFRRNRNVGRSRKRPLSASSRRGVHPLSAPARNGETEDKKGQKASADDSSRLSSLEKPCVSQACIPPARAANWDLLPKQSPISWRREPSKRVKTALNVRNQETVRFEKLRSAQGAWKQSLRSVSTSLTLSRLPLKRTERGHGHFADSVPKTMPARYEMRRYPFGIVLLAVFKRNTRLPPTFLDKVVKSAKSVLVSLLHFALSTKTTRTAFLPQFRKCKFYGR